MKKTLRSEFQTRQYMISDHFEIYYYSDTNLHTFKSHTHDYYEFYFFLEGNVDIQITNTRYPLHYGDVVLLPPDVPHHAIIHDTKLPYRRFVFWISRTYMDVFLQRSPHYGYVLTRAQNGHYLLSLDRLEANGLHARIIHLIEEQHSGRFAKDAALTLCIEELLLSINRLCHEKDHPVNTKKESSLYENLLSYIDQNPEADLSLDALAGHFYVSKYHISHVFKDHTGISLHQYVLKKRLLACKHALLAGEAATSFYENYGFSDYSAFYRAFKKEFGMSPKEFHADS